MVTIVVGIVVGNIDDKVIGNVDCKVVGIVDEIDLGSSSSIFLKFLFKLQVIDCIRNNL